MTPPLLQSYLKWWQILTRLTQKQKQSQHSVFWENFDSKGLCRLCKLSKNRGLSQMTEICLGAQCLAIPVRTIHMHACAWHAIWNCCQIWSGGMQGKRSELPAQASWNARHGQGLHPWFNSRDWNPSSPESWAAGFPWNKSWIQTDYPGFTRFQI